MPPVTPSPPSHPPSAPYVWPPYPVAYRPDVGPQVPWGRDPTNVVGRRLASFLLDGVVFWAAYGLLFLLALAVEYEGMPYDPDTESANPCDELRDTHEECVAIGNTTYVSEDTPVLPVLVLLVPVGMVLLEGLVGGSPGQLAVGLRTVRGDGRRAGLGRVVVRWLLWIVDGVPYCFPLVGLVVGLSTRDHQRVGDVVAGTYVVRRRDLGRPVGWSVGWSAFPNQ